MKVTRTIGLAAVALVVATAGLGLAHGVWAKTLKIEGIATTGYANAEFVDASTNDPPGTMDPGYDKDVASCVPALVSTDLVQILILNGYPSYACRFTTTIYNGGTLPARRDALVLEAPPAITITELNSSAEIVLEPGEEYTEEFTVHVEQEAAQGATYYFSIRKPFRLWVEGTIGFWKNWNSHNTFSQDQIEAWLTEIDATSVWLGPTTVDEMESVLSSALGLSATPYDRFLGHYLATRLNERSGILDPGDAHDVTGEDPGNYLGLLDPGSATLSEIIAAIESKYGTTPSNSQFIVMKTVCNAVNNLSI